MGVSQNPFAVTPLSVPEPEEDLIPAGLIAQFQGAIVDIPDGWANCDGTQGTPDLRSLFVRAAGSGVAINETGGVSTHTHSFDGDGHSHDLPSGTDLAPGNTWSAESGSDAAVGVTDEDTNIPPYFALLYIMKL